MPETYYKILNENGSCYHSGIGRWHLPTANKPGKWMPRIKGPLALCKNGYHILRADQLVLWLGPAIFTVEPKGKIVHDTEKSVCEQARLLTRLTAWNDRTARLFGADCAEHVLPIFQKHFPDDMRPALAIAAARAFADGRITRDELDAARAAARAAAWDASWAARAAARAAAWDAAWAARAAARAAAWAAAQDAAWAADWAAARAAETEWQTTRLLEYLKVVR